MKWIDRTETFTEEQRYYKNVYLEKCEVYDDEIEVSLFSSNTAPYEIYVSYGMMYGIVYSAKDNAYLVMKEIKEELEKEYHKNKKPTDEFIEMFVEKYGLSMPMDIFFD